MKKILTLALVFMLVLVGCSTNQKSSTPSKKPKVVATTTFINDMVKEIAKDKVDVHNIIKAGVDPHLFEAKVSDIQEISKADLVLYSGLHLEAKMTDILSKANRNGKTSVAVTKDIDKKKLLTLVEDNEEVVDPHFWFDLDLYKRAIQTVTEQLSQLTPANKEFYETNLKAYEKKLDELKEYAKKEIAKIPTNSRYLVTAHDAFQYLANSQDIKVKALQGVSTDSEIATKDVIELVDFIYEHKIKSIYAESTISSKNIEAIQHALANKGFKVQLGKELYSDSLSDDEHDANTFLKMFKYNIDAIVEGLK